MEGQRLQQRGVDGIPDMLAALVPEQIFDAIAIRVDGPRAWDLRLSIGLESTDTCESYRLDLRNGVPVSRSGSAEGADALLRLPRTALPLLLGGTLEGIDIDGDASVLPRLMAVLEPPDPDFAIVTP